MVTAGAFSCVFCSFGWINCEYRHTCNEEKANRRPGIGIFQDYYQSHQLQSYSSSTIAWIASLELFIMFAGSPIVGRFYDNYGPRYIILTGTFFHVFGLLMTSLCKGYYQILLAQGVCSAIGTSCLFSPATNCVLTWFHKKRAFAIGIVAGGSSLGGVIFPIMLNHLIRQVGFGWAIRIAAFMILGMLIFGNLTLSSRLPPSPKELKLVQYFAPLKEKTYLSTTVGSFLFYLGMFLPINYIQYQATSYGMSESLAEYLIPILNATSLFGRILPGWIGDKVGRYNTQIATCLFSGIIALALWIPAKHTAPLIVFAALYGFGSGAFVSLLPAMIAQISDVREIGLRVGLEFAVMSVAALVSNLIGGALIQHDHGSFRDLQIFCGVVLLAGSVGFIMARLSLNRKLLAMV
ncbi:MCT family MFS transporter [Aspergillus homomorphus CBS 101889]|uniref:MFS general substrate transporter n=1 Tax=Aspergillus homomorphus (strain CBS 101889) TaxID=1450537 RepID=A0A395I7S1_ASPHC|nr:MFS general substrate transporter [Aspergillus homomorphus CBS 101889]RAL15303.1 MFS general substrate transporter [Aspergillus homomorphus CBS 101889]